MTTDSEMKRRVTAAVLAFYWIVLFILSHIPIPRVVYQAHVSDKSLHFVAYMILAFLVWYSVSDEPVRWRRWKVWVVLVLLAGYGVVDELVQGLVGRSCELRDFAADLAGVMTALVICTFLTFWAALLTVAGISLFFITNLARANVSRLMPVTSGMFYFFGYAFFTVVWVVNLRAKGLRRWPLAGWGLVLPILLLAVSKVYAVWSGRFFGWDDTVIATAGIIFASAISAFTCRNLPSQQ